MSCPGPDVPLEVTAPWHFRVPCPHCQRSAPCRRSGLLSRRKWSSHHLPVMCFKETQVAAPLNGFSRLARQPPCTQVTRKQGQHSCPGPSSDVTCVQCSHGLEASLPLAGRALWQKGPKSVEKGIPPGPVSLEDSKPRLI